MSDTNYNVIKNDFNKHIILLITSFCFIFLNLAVHQIWPITLVGIILFFLYYSWRRILSILLSAILCVAIIALLPFLAPIAFVIMVILFFRRINYFFDNFPVMLVGFYMYGVAWFSIAYTTNFHFHQPSIEMILIIATFSTLIFHFLLKGLYKLGYTLDIALPMMATMPLIILLLILPFVKTIDAFEGSGGDIVSDSVETSHNSNIDSVGEVRSLYNSPSENIDHINVDSNPGTHYTNDYYRMGSNGEIQHVRGYVATNPDGVLENNFSYKGESHSIEGREIKGSEPDLTSEHNIQIENTNKPLEPIIVPDEKKRNND
jgi:hypothetical protein